MKDRHLTHEEVIALSDGRIELLSSIRDHIASCESCKSQIELFSSSLDVLRSKNNIRHYLNSEKIEATALNSFSYITAEKPEKESIFSFILNPIPAATMAILFLTIFAASFFLNKNTANSSPKIAKQIEAPQSIAPELPVLQTELTEITQGATIALKRASITTVASSMLRKIDSSNIYISRGSIDVTVTKGDGFFVHINKSHIVRVLGTRFIITTDEKRGEVSVIEGLVEIINKNTNKTWTLTRNMKHVFNHETTTEKPAPEKKIVKKQPRRSKPVISFLKQGRTEMKKKNYNNALIYFEKEINKGTQKDKALFEIVRIMEKRNNYKTLLSKMAAHQSIIKRSNIYKEEFYIKGCKAQSRAKDDSLSHCHDYLRLFPEGYKKDEIASIIGVGK